MTSTPTTPPVAELKELSTLPLKPRPKIGRKAFAVAIILIVVYIAVAFVQGDIVWETVGTHLTSKEILSGLVYTVVMTFIAMAIGIGLGIVLALMRLVPNVVLNRFSVAYIWLFRGVPQLLQLYLWYNIALVFPKFGIPGLFQVDTIGVMTPILATVLALGLAQAAYTSEVIRSGIISVDKGQSEAAMAIGMKQGRVMRRIILPQAMRTIVPPVGNEFIGMVKFTSLASVIQFPEILHAAQNVYLVSGQVIELLLVATFWYLVVVTVFSVGQHFIEKRYARGFGSTAKAKRK